MDETEGTNQSGSRFPALTLIGIGGFLLLNQIFNFDIGSTLWPLFVMIPGLPFLYYAIKGGRHNAGLIFPGLIITGTGAILLFQNTFDHFESWAYIWTLYPVFIGMGLVFNGKRTGSNGEVNTGRGMIRYGLMALAGLALLFEVFIFQSVLGGLTQFLLPFALIGTGLLFLKGRGRSERKHIYREKPKHIMKRKTQTKEAHDPYARLYDQSAEINPDLQRRIHQAINEDEPEIV